MRTTHRKSHKSNRKQNSTQAGLNGNRPHTGKKKSANRFNPSQTATAAASTKLNEAELVGRFTKKVPLIKVWGKQWHRYAEYWEPIERGIYKKKALGLIPKPLRSAHLASQILDHFEALQHLDKDEFTGAAIFDGPDILLCVANGVLRIDPTGQTKLEAFSSVYPFTMQLAAKYDPKALAPNFQETLKQALADPLDRELYRYWMGSILLPDSRFETALCCFGPTGTSKSTLAIGLTEALGAEPVTVLKLSEICDSVGYRQPTLVRSMLNVSTELDAAVLENSEDFKRLVSGEEIEAREIYGKPFKMRTSAKFLFLCNQLPRFKYGTDAELRRLQFLRFSQIPKVKDVELKKTKIPTEKDGIFILMVDYLAKLLQLGKIPDGSAESISLRERFAETNDPLANFIKKFCVLHPQASVLKTRLLKRFAAYVIDLGLPRGITNDFFKNLYDRYPALKPIRRRIGKIGRQQRVEGIRLR